MKDKGIYWSIKMDIVNKYFDKLVFTRIDEKETMGQRFTVYGAGINCRFEDGNARYVLVFVPAHLAIKTKANIRELPWENLQTRHLHYSYRLRKQSWNPSRDLQDVDLQVTKREKTYSTYTGPPGFPFEVLMLHDPRKKTVYQFHNKLRVSAALESFSTVFNYKGEASPMEYTTDPQDFDDSFELIG